MDFKNHFMICDNKNQSLLFILGISFACLLQKKNLLRSLR